MEKGIYRHYKGNLYEMMGTATHSETMEEMVVYKALYGLKQVWVRPEEMWKQWIEGPDGSIQRFVYLGEKRAETKRLVFLPLHTGYDKVVFALTSSPQVAKFMRFNAHTTIAQTRELLSEYSAKGTTAFALWEKETGTFCGIFAFKQEDGMGAYSLSIFLAEQSWGKGLASETLNAMKQYAKDKLLAQSLTAYVVEDNLGSRCVLEKNRFSIREKLTFPDMTSSLLVYGIEI